MQQPTEQSLQESRALTNIQQFTATLFAKSQNCIFEPRYRGIRGNISALCESFTAKKLCSKVLSIECQFYS